jgi:hypothetical protein
MNTTAGLQVLKERKISSPLQEIKQFLHHSDCRLVTVPAKLSWSPLITLPQQQLQKTNINNSYFLKLFCQLQDDVNHANASRSHLKIKHKSVTTSVNFSSHESKCLFLTKP